jgi:hypothetical protein
MLKIYFGLEDCPKGRWHEFLKYFLLDERKCHRQKSNQSFLVACQLRILLTYPGFVGEDGLEDEAAFENL